MANSEKVLVGDRVRWECIDGPVRGEVVGFIEQYNTFGEICTRMQIELPDGRLQYLGMNPDYLEMMRFKVIFRDIDVQLAQAAKDLMSLSIRAA